MRWRGRTIKLLAACVDGAMIVLGGVGCEVVWDGQGQVQAKAGDEYVTGAVHVRELQL